MRIYLLMFTLVLTWLAQTSVAAACSCLPPDKGRSYDNADNVVHVRIQAALGATSTTRSFSARLVEDDFKGCLAAGARVIVETAANSAACGMSLSVGKQYLLHGKRVGTSLGTPRLRVVLCDANVAWSALTPEHRAFLDTRYVCCGGDCACTDGSQPVNCFVDPCEVSSCNVAGASCRSNYCGGCHAEWYDSSDGLVCEAPQACDYDAPDRDYVSRDPDECATIRFICMSGEAFFDGCGCGCVVPAASTTAGCKVGGCSGQLCIEPGDSGISTCEWRPEYACYRTATCERQASGGCGWTSTPELQACLSGTM